MGFLFDLIKTYDLINSVLMHRSQIVLQGRKVRKRP